MAQASAAASSSSLLLFSSLSSTNPRLFKSPISSLPIPSNSFISTPLSSSCRSSSSKTTRRPTNSSQHSISPSSSSSSSASTSPLEALIFDCDGVILESEHLHRTAYNDAFAHFDVRCPPSSSQPLLWDPEFYDVLQNQIGGGKPKMRWYFGENGWPSSKVFGTPPAADSDREKLIDTIQDWKTERYKEIIKSGSVEPRPGVLRLMDEAKAAGIKLAVCSAATKSSVILCLENLLGLERFHGLDCFLAGDDVKEKKPDPSIYLTASKKLGVLGKNCLVVEDSIIGLQAATAAGMPCLVTYTSSTANQDFKDAITIYPDLSNLDFKDESYLTNGYLDTRINWIKGMKDIRLRDLPSFVQTTDPNDFMLNFAGGEAQRAFKSSALILNTFHDLEHEVLTALASMFPHVYSIGSLSLLLNQIPDDTQLKSIGSNLWKEETECLEWLDTKEPGSVVYVNFGSITVMTPQQLSEFAWGLANSNHPFLWVIRPDLVTGDSAMLPDGFVKMTQGRGLLASWCPQEDVLAHTSVGGFLTHCGWNSTLESVCAGVPVICWPFFAEQQTNCWLAINELGIGMEIDSNVKRESVEGLVRELMGNGDKGRMMRTKAMELKEKAKNAAVEGVGSSFLNLEKVVNQILRSDFLG